MCTYPWGVGIGLGAHGLEGMFEIAEKEITGLGSRGYGVELWTPAQHAHNISENFMSLSEFDRSFSNYSRRFG